MPATCPELLSKSTAERMVKEPTFKLSVRVFEFPHASPTTQRLITGWFDRGWENADCPANESFEPFIFTWIAFNGWAACITGEDGDRAWLDALMLDPTVAEHFDTLLEGDGRFARRVGDFAQLWPIFRSQELRRNHIERPYGANRAAVVEHYLANGATLFEPRCFLRHRDEHKRVVDWAHTLAALYRVRCNLFHGDKGANSEMDSMIVQRAFAVLGHLLEEYMRHGVRPRR